MDDATRNQIEAADPLRSTWLTANAGSGKTRVLTDRVARLLLRGVAPERILCLTYTKAAATEMQNRLLARLGAWAMLGAGALTAELARLGETDAPDLAQARRLFARAIETPGGLKVQTIHSFCGGVLRRFPIEAGVPLGFTELDERSAALIRAEIIDEMAEAGDPAVADLTALHSGHELDGFLASLRAEDFAAPPDAAAIWAGFGLAPGYGAHDLLGAVFLGGEADWVRPLTDVLAGGKPTDAKLGAALASVRWDAPRVADVAALAGALLFGATAKSPFGAKIGSLPTKDMRNGAAAPYMDRLDDLMRRVEAARAPMIALAQAQDSLRLHRFGHAFTTRYGARKSDHGLLDFDDLITRTAHLLGDGAMAQWVLFRLDGGIDHILVDEAQDTSPAQWQVIRHLTAEFTSGMGAHDRPRSLFVVGDPKQSIYSFQGADMAVFDAMKAQFSADFAAVQAPMQDRGLLHSFRSSPAILRLVDAVFSGPGAQGLGGDPRHLAFHEALPGRVDIWPPIPKPDKDDPAPWWQPVDAPAENAAEAVLARAVADQIAAIIGQPFHSIREGRVRPIRPGDVLILVQRRSTLFHAIIGACKAAGLPIAGADRLRLAAELAVRDIAALCQVLATPEDDLALASALKSPLFGVDEDTLFRLAHGRRGGLWQALREAGHPAMAVLYDLAAHADRLRPYDLVMRMLGRHGGRARLLARLGPEAEDGITEFLSQALTYETTEPPSLTGFLVWLAGDDVVVKRQVAGADADLIRVMTVHGAKGLEAPVVIMPDTARRKHTERSRAIALGDGAMAWRGTAGAQAPRVAEAIAAERSRAEDERRRLLYVGLTRAESWLIVAAAGDTGAGLDSWHAMVAAGAGHAGLDADDLDVPGVGRGLRLSWGDWPADAAPAPARAPVAACLPGWADRPAPAGPAPVPVWAATGLGGAKVVAGGPGGEGAAAMLRGTRLHLLLEVLPGAARADWPDLAATALAGAEGGLPDADTLADLLAEAGDVITAPDLAAVMTPDPGDQVLAEVALTAPFAGGVLHGVVDRLVIGADRVLVIDYKSNAAIPARPEDTPLGILRQMAAYRGALAAIYPGRRIDTAVLWTAGPVLMRLDDAALDRVAAQMVAGLDPGPPPA